MADIFGGVEPPAWLQRIAQPVDMSVTGKVIGELIGGMTNAYTQSRAKQKAGDTSASFLGELRTGIANARINVADPMGQLKLQAMQVKMAEQGVKMNNEQALLNMRKNKLTMLEHDQQTFPAWMEGSTWESRQDKKPPILYTPEFQRAYNELRMRDASDMKAKAQTEATHSFSKRVDALSTLDPEAAAPFAQYIGQVPTPEISEALGKATNEAQAKHEKTGIATYQKDYEVLRGLDAEAAAPFAQYVGQVPTPEISKALGAATSKAKRGTRQEKIEDVLATERGKEQIRAEYRPAKQGKIPPSLANELIAARGRSKKLYDLLHDPTLSNKRKITELQGQFDEAEKYLKGLETKADEAVAAPLKFGSAGIGTGGGGGAPAANPNDPFNLGISAPGKLGFPKPNLWDRTAP